MSIITKTKISIAFRAVRQQLSPGGHDALTVLHDSLVVRVWNVVLVHAFIEVSNNMASPAFKNIYCMEYMLWQLGHT